MINILQDEITTSFVVSGRFLSLDVQSWPRDHNFPPLDSWSHWYILAAKTTCRDDWTLVLTSLRGTIVNYRELTFIQYRIAKYLSLSLFLFIYLFILTSQNNWVFVMLTMENLNTNCTIPLDLEEVQCQLPSSLA